MQVVAVIPARGGSVGLPGKNIKPLNGIPLLGRSVLAAVGSKLISQVYVSSDSEAILSVGKEFGASAIVRPNDISGSQASSESALVHALRYVQDTAGALPDVLVFLQCTSPFTTSEQIDELVRQLVEKRADSAFSAVEDHGFIWEIAPDGTASGITHDHTKPRKRRQDMTPRYRENGAIYAMRVSSFLESENRFCGKTILVPTEMLPVEIDTPDDWSVAEVFAQLHDSSRIRGRVERIKALVTDFDGVHTDDRVLVHQDGSESVYCSRSDGMGIEMLRRKGLKLLILSKEKNPVVRARAEKLNMAVQHHVEDKLSALEVWRMGSMLAWSEVAYIGNDINDIECMKACGLSFCPSDAHPSIKKIADVILNHAGGKGALRELSEYLLANDHIA
ncbi:acylneuraminate cytidylyltransferase [Shinella sp. WSJ-2]|uniref:acylneuraminate cytidylyltransferase n=1 Tax=Shinella sp. WSJ-2 TaxID=2303749 RepID=UPI000E3D43B7|nr:acylneuraminate cytidylyltransferase [Shinella sp. WSJ-2]RFZ88817.1 acylneuraminate cytidylyltransferase [Shinella sp. WSJ-2]